MNKKRKLILSIVVCLIVVALGSIAAYYWYNNTYYVSTDDAQVTGDLVKVTPQISGKLLEFTVEEGQQVVEDQIIGRQEMSGLPDSSVDMAVVRAPIKGIVVKKEGVIGELETAGQTLAVIVDPEKLYINANIEETKVNKVEIGQMVDVTIDQYSGAKFKGKVRSIGSAANSAFSLLPSSTSGTFTKTVQRIPVKIELEETKYRLLPGTNAVVRIHIK